MNRNKYANFSLGFFGIPVSSWANSQNSPPVYYNYIKINWWTDGTFALPKPEISLKSNPI